MSAPEAAESSSRGRRDADADPDPERPPPEVKWVALVSSIRENPLRDTDIHIDYNVPPYPSYLWLHPRFFDALDPGHLLPRASAYILAADRSGRILFRVTGHRTNVPAPSVMYLSDTNAGTLTSLPAATMFDLGVVEAQPRRSIGLIADPGQPGEYLIVHLHTRTALILGNRLICYSTATGRWFLKHLLPDPVPRDPSAETAVIAYGGRLWWVALAYGLFFCDPFADGPRLRFVPLPPGCELQEGELVRIHRDSIAQRRHVGLSEGVLRYVEVQGLPYPYQVHFFSDVAVAPKPVNPIVRMWTLVDTEAEEPWELYCEARFAAIWAHRSYVRQGLLPGNVPQVAFVHPENHDVVYFLQGSKIFGLDVPAGQVVSCEECPVPVRDDREIRLRNSRGIIDAWELLPLEPPGPDHSSSSSSDEATVTAPVVEDKELPRGARTQHPGVKLSGKDWVNLE